MSEDNNRRTTVVVIDGVFNGGAGVNGFNGVCGVVSADIEFNGVCGVCNVWSWFGVGLSAVTNYFAIHYAAMLVNVCLGE